MLDSAWLFVGRIAFAWTVLTLAAASYVNPVDNSGDAVATIGGVVGFILWGVWTYGALQIEVVDGSSTVTFTHPELAILGVALSLVPGYVALTGPFELVSRFRDGNMDEL